MTWGAQFLEYGKVIGFSIILALFIRCFVVQAFHIPTGSMIPTFLVGDRVLVNKFSYGIRNPFTNAIWIKIGEPQRGDVVVFKYPKDPKNDFVKRVIGLPGEKLEIIASQVYINDQPIPDERAFYRYTELPKSYRNFGPIVVPQDCYFMMGDNRDQSNDSREWGCVESALLRGKAWRIYWSVDPSQDRPFFSRLRTDRMGHKVE
ncbi:MAG: signal peptidase I [Deltaproteobacteria bacterium]|nr:signal peptidase I [Deltaproteobacteria bacterium]